MESKRLGTESARIVSIDLVRGIIMVLMALDHVRYWLTDVRFPPEDLVRSWPLLFFTRWITHLCAPGFFFLAGVSAWMSGRRTRAPDLADHLWKRGLWLITLELTVIGFAWSFYPGYSFAGVIWALGWSMIVLSVFVRVRRGVSLMIGTSVIVAHHLFELVPPDGSGMGDLVWRLLYVPGSVRLPGTDLDWFVLYPLVPWFGVMLVGYGLGPWFSRSRPEQSRQFTFLGLVLLASFLILRVTNAYGYPSSPFSAADARFAPRDSLTSSIMSLLNVEKYPPSLQFLLLTLGAICLFFGVVEKTGVSGSHPLIRPLITFGQVPMFFYILHLYLIHIVAIVVASWSGQPSGWLIGNPDPVAPSGYGHGLGVVYLVWLAVVLVLWGPSWWFADIRRRRRFRWLRYF